MYQNSVQCALQVLHPQSFDTHLYCCFPTVILNCDRDVHRYEAHLTATICPADI